MEHTGPNKVTLDPTYAQSSDGAWYWFPSLDPAERAKYPVVWESEEDALEAGLAALLAVQRRVSAVDPIAMAENEHGEPTKETLATYGFALASEVIELVKETSWRPWRDRKEVDKERFADEFADVLAFLGLWVKYAGMFGLTPKHLAGAYARKSKVNVARLRGEVEGFGGELDDKR